MSWRKTLVNSSVKTITRILCRIDAEEMAQVPAEGPLIVYSNHINFLDVAIVYTQLLPRPLAGYAKAENWNHPILRRLFELWGAIPLNRHEADLNALREGIKAIKQGSIFGIAPEGTRSGHGRLLPGHPGVVTLALRSGAPLQPLAIYGHEHFWGNFRKLRRTDFHARLGQPFYLDAGGERVNSEVRQKMITELMYQLAALMPPENRGAYADLESATETYLRFPPDSASNLPTQQPPSESGRPTLT